jgi:hypothetical protein
MKKKLVFLLVIIVLTSMVFLFPGLSNNRNKLGSRPEDFVSLSDSEARRGEYTVRLIQTSQNTYGFDIRKDNTVIYLQMSNPFYATPEGFISPNDAFNVGWWIVDKIREVGRPPLSTDFNEALAKELNIRPNNF